MHVARKQDWKLTPREAVQEQKRLAAQLRAEDEFGPIHFVAGVDVGFEQEKTVARAAVVVLAFPSLEPVEQAIARKAVTFPYIPGLLSYRELPVILDAFETLTREVDLVIMDGHGYAHPRRFGIASHLGVALDKPSIGCAKSVLVGSAETPENRIGAWTPLMHHGEVIGAAVRTKLNGARPIRPIYVSVGHRVSLESAIGLVLACCKGYRVPETTRYAHRAASGEDVVGGKKLKAKS